MQNRIMGAIPKGCAINTSVHPRWNERAYYGTDNFNITLLPGGIRELCGTFSSVGEACHLWTSTVAFSSYNIAYTFQTNSYAFGNTWGEFGFSTRAIKDYTGRKRDGTVIEDAYTDGSGNVYDAVVVGSQLWITENLKTTKNQSGDDITNLTDAGDWGDTSGTSLPAYCWYNNDYSTYGQYYGALYNVFAIRDTLVDGDGWRVFSSDDFLNLLTYLETKYTDISSSNISQYLKSCRQVNHPLA